jgi:hypothetical protein
MKNTVIDARKLTFVQPEGSNVYYRTLNTEIKFAVEDSIPGFDPWKIHDWFWCLKGTRGYKSRVHPY